MRLPVRIVIPCSGLTGYGGFSLGLLKHLKDSKRIAPEFTALYNEIQPSFPEEYRSLIGATWNVRRLGLVIGTPPRVAQSGTSYTILYTMYEADDIPDKWKYDLKRADEVWVPSMQCREVFSRYHPRVKLLHIGYDDTVYKRQKGPRKAFWKDIDLPLLEKAFVVGDAGVMSTRKGPDILAAAFLQAFPDGSPRDPEAYLVIKSRDSKVEPIRHPRIIWIEEDWPLEKMAAFYRALDVLAAPCRSEGFSLCPLEAAACGTLAMTTRWSGPCEYIDDVDILGIAVAAMEPVRNMEVQKAQWAKPSTLELTRLLLQCYNAPRRVKPNLSYWSHSAMARRFEDALLDAVNRIR